jgi:hypothetical protein
MAADFAVMNSADMAIEATLARLAERKNRTTGGSR